MTHEQPCLTPMLDLRLVIAVSRGLLLDLLATGDRDHVDDAMRRYVAMLDSGSG